MENRAARRRAAAAAHSAKASARQQSTAWGPASSQPAASTKHAAGDRAESEETEPQALVVSHWFHPGDEGEPYSATIRLTGRRVGARAIPRPEDTFVQEDTVDGILPAGSPVTVSTWVYGIQPGEWDIAAELIGPESRGGAPGLRTKRSSGEPIPRARWSWRRWAASEAPAGPLKTRWALIAPLAGIPGVVPGSFTALAALSVVVALIVQAIVLGRDGIPVGQALLVSLVALGAGLIAAKVWYAILKGGPWRQALLGGWAVDGFLVVAPVVAIALLLAFNLPVGVYLDGTTPGIFFAVAIGRIGCFFTGCCAGRPTHSRWGIWSSDRKVGARRIPTQLIESGTGLVLGVVTTLLIVGGVPGIRGLVFVAALAVYFVVRQVLLRLRAESRPYSWRRSATAVAARP